ncbi:glycosyltransferase family 4 protein [Schleiferiaceae bacterium]|nr:glycosyltransferase family 4 protein [Schleiferiaceae bacterium]
MKICFISGLYPYSKGGAEYQAKILSDCLGKVHDIIFISSVPGSREAVLFTDGKKIYNRALGFTQKLLFYFPFSLWIRSIFLKEAPDLIYHRVIMPYTLFAIKYAERLNIPFILHIASERSIVFDSSLKARLKRYLVHRILESNAHIIVQTEQQQNILASFSSRETTVLPNLLDNNYSVKQDTLGDSVLWIGKSIKLKGLEIFMDMAEKMPHMQFVVICRFLNDNYSRRLKSKLESVKNIVNLGEQDNDFINMFLATKSYLLVNTSSSEGFSSTFIQAWMVGVPVLSLNSNPSGIFDHYEMGVYCNGDEDKLLDALNDFVGNDQYYIRVSEICRQVAFEKYSVEAISTNYQEYFEAKVKLA